MRLVEYKGKAGPESHEILSSDEAGARGVKYLENWRTASTGDWVLTDDGYVVEVLASGHLRAGQAWIRTCTRTIQCKKDLKLTCEEQESRYTFNGKAPQGLHTGVTPRVDAFARLVARGLSEGKVDPAAAYQAVNPRSSRQHAERRAQWLLKKKEVREIIDMELGDILEQIGCSKRWVLEQMMEVAMDVDNSNARLGALKELAGYHGLAKKQTTETTVKFKGIPTSSFEAAEASIEASTAPMEIPSETDRETIIKLLPKAEEVDQATVEASMEVTLEETGIEDADEG